MNSLSPSQRGQVDALVEGLAQIAGVRAVVLGGSHARGRARPDSDIDLGVFYADLHPPDLVGLRALATRWNDEPNPVVTEPWAWGRWVNGGAWLTVDGQRIDWLYRSLEHVQRTIEAARSGEFELDFAQLPPFGYASVSYLGELEICEPLFDPDGVVATLRARLGAYPEPLRRAIVDRWLWAIDFHLASFATSFAARGDVWAVSACLSRAVFQLAHVIFALNRRYPLNDKTLLVEVAELEVAPKSFAERSAAVLAKTGHSPGELAASLARVRALFEETAELAGPLYTARRRP